MTVKIEQVTTQVRKPTNSEIVSLGHVLGSVDCPACRGCSRHGASPAYLSLSDRTRRAITGKCPCGGQMHIIEIRRKLPELQTLLVDTLCDKCGAQDLPPAEFAELKSGLEGK